MSSGIPCCSTVLGSPPAELTIENIGGGAGWFAGLAGTVAQFKTITVSGGLVLTPSGDDIDIGGGALAANCDIHCAFTMKDTGYLGISEVAYTPAASPAFIYRGSGTMGVPTAIKIVVAVSDAGKPQDVRIQDTTNGNTIAEVIGLVNPGQAIVDLGAIANVAAGEAIWQVQPRGTTGGETQIASVDVLF